MLINLHYDAGLSTQEVEALQQLASNSSPITCKPDKGNGVVVADKVDYRYVEKMINILSNR